MNIGITTSFIIGGLLLLAMLQFSNQVSKNAAEITMDINGKHHIVTLRQILEHDFNRIGFGPNNKIVSFQPPHKINFKIDIPNKGSRIIRWHFKENTPANNTSNPNDRILQRNGPLGNSNSSKKRAYKVVDFKLTGYSDPQGENITTDKNKIRSILVEIVYESPETISPDASNAQYARSTWRKFFVPNNLQFNNL